MRGGCAEDMRSYKFDFYRPFSGARIGLVLGFMALGISPVWADSEDPSLESDELYAEMRIPPYQKHFPELAIELTTSFNAFGRQALVVEQGSHGIYAISLGMEYQPAFLQSIGVIGIGPYFTSYPSFGASIAPSALSLLGVGAQIRYQARYFREQPIVPMVAYSGEYFNYEFNSGMKGHLVSSGPTVGAWLLLNFLEPRAAAQFYSNTGISRSYAVVEYRMLKGSNSDLAFSGGSYYVGLRIEY